MSLILCLFLASCSKGASLEEKDNVTPSEGFGDSSYPDDVSQKNEASSGVAGQDTQLLVKYLILQAETVDFSQSTACIETNAISLGGYIGSSRISGGDLQSGSKTVRRAQYTVRIPSEKADAYLALLKEQMNIVSETSTVTDVTASHTDMQARLHSLTAQEERVLAMLEDAKDLDTLLLLDDKLTSIRSEIERLQTELKQLENRVSYATVEISLQEVIAYTPDNVSFSDKLKNAFIGSWTDFGENCMSFFVWFVSAIPTLLILAGIAVAVVIPIRHSVRKKKKREEELREAYLRAQQNGGK